MSARNWCSCRYAFHASYEFSSTSPPQFGGPHDGRPFSLPTDRPHWGHAKPFSIESLSLRVDVRIESKSLLGDCTLRVRRVDGEARSLYLDAVDFELDSVEVQSGTGEWTSAPHHYDGAKIILDIPPSWTTFSVRVRYCCTPRRGLYFVTRRAPRSAPRTDDTPTEVWSQGQDEDNRHWFPCADHPNQRMATELIATVPRGWFALSNGELVSRELQNERERFHWKQSEPHPSYLVTLACGAFEHQHERLGDLPIDYYVPPGESRHIERSFGRTKAMIEFFQTKLKTPFPWAKYAQVVVTDFIFGGMENTSATTIYDRVLLDERAALDVDMDSLVSHELAHQWFGDLVTCRDWSHAWLNEGFATYLEHLWRQHVDGDDEYLYGLEQDLDAYLEEERDRYRRPIVTNTWSAPIDLFDRHLYQKGGLTLHALRQHLGDRAFFDGIANYLRVMRGRGAETRDLLRAIEDESGRSLEAFFDQWVMRAGHPQLEISSEYESGILRIQVVQTQAKLSDAGTNWSFDLPVDVVSEAGSARHRLSITRPRETFSIALGSPPKMIRVDPETSVIAAVENRLSTALLTEQLAHSTSAQPRWRAARTLAKRNEPRAVGALIRGLEHDAFWGVRAECAVALGEQRNTSALEALLAARYDADPKVRRAVASALGRFRCFAPDDPGTRAASSLIEWIERGDASYLVEHELRKSLGRTRDDRALGVLANCVENDPVSWGDVVKQGAIEGLAASKRVESIPLLIAACRPSEAATTRRSAVMGLGRVRDVEDGEPTVRAAREAIERTLDAFDTTIRIAAVRALAILRDSAGIPAAQRVANQDLDGRVRRAARESLRELRDRNARSKEVSGLRDELEQMRTEMRELRTRLSSLEAKGRS